MAAIDISRIRYLRVRIANLGGRDNSKSDVLNPFRAEPSRSSLTEIRTHMCMANNGYFVFATRRLKGRRFQLAVLDVRRKEYRPYYRFRVLDLCR